MKSLLSLFAFLWKHPKMLIGGLTVFAVVSFTGWQIIRAERAERKLAQITADHVIQADRLSTCTADLDSRYKQVQQYIKATDVERKKRVEAEKRARVIRVRTVKAVREIQAEAIPQDCTTAIEYGATHAPEVAEWPDAL